MMGRKTGAPKSNDGEPRRQVFREGYENRGGVMGPVVNAKRPPSPPALKPKPSDAKEGAK